MTRNPTGQTLNPVALSQPHDTSVLKCLGGSIPDISHTSFSFGTSTPYMHLSMADSHIIGISTSCGLKMQLRHHPHGCMQWTLTESSLELWLCQIQIAEIVLNWHQNWRIHDHNFASSLFPEPAQYGNLQDQEEKTKIDSPQKVPKPTNSWHYRLNFQKTK